MPVNKDTIMQVKIPSNDWSTFDSEKVSVKVIKIIIDGKETKLTDYS